MKQVLKSQLVIFQRTSVTSLIINLSLQPRKNLQILLSISVFSIIRNLNILVPALLLRLSHLHPLLGREVLAKLREDILRQSKPVEQRAIRNWVENDLVVRASSK